MTDDPNNRDLPSPIKFDELMGGATGKAIRDLLDEIKTISESLKALSSLDPTQIAQGTKAHAQSYNQLGGASVSASRASAQTPGGTAPGTGWTQNQSGAWVPNATPVTPYVPPPIPQPRTNYVQPELPFEPPRTGGASVPLHPEQQQLFQPGTAPTGYAPFSPSSPQPQVPRQESLSNLGKFGRWWNQTAPGASVASARQVEGKANRFNAFSDTYRSISGDTPIGPGIDEDERDALGLPPVPRTGTGGGGPSRPEDPNANNYARQVLGQDILNQPITMPRLEGGRFTMQNLLDSLSSLTARSAVKAADSDPEGLAGQSRANAAYWLNKAGNTYAPGISMAHQYSRSIMHKLGMGGITERGYTQGVSPEDGLNTIGIGGYGFRLPGILNPSGRKGAEIQLSELRQSLKSGLNRDQVSTIYENLFSRGWFFDNKRFGGMRDSMNQLTQWNPSIGQNPMSFDMLDKSTRMGMTSLSDFVGIMKQIPDSAKAANVSLEQMQVDMDAMGQANKDRGGTYAGGMAQASAFSRMTGLPANIQTSLLDNPFISAQSTLQFGLAPWQSGLMTPEQQTSATVGGILQMYNAVGQSDGRSFVDKATGLRTEISGENLRLANLQKVLGPNAPDIATLRSIVRHGQTTMESTDAEASFRAFSQEVGRTSRDGNLTFDERKKKIDRLYSSSGKPMKGLMSQLRGAGLSKDEIADIMDEGKDKNGAEKATAQFKKLESVLAKKNENMSTSTASGPGNMYQIGLTSEAKRFFKLSSSNKGKAGAGQGSTNSSNGLGPTTIGP